MPQQSPFPDVVSPLPSAASRAGAGGGVPSIIPIFPLFLLETLRDMDRPEEVLEGEDMAVSMPRRLGLSDVVFVQIHRFREEVRRKRPQTPAVVEDLMRLVIKRPDADEIFVEAGRRVARRAWEERAGAYRVVVARLPTRLAMSAAKRALRRLLRQLVGAGAEFQVVGQPPTLRLADAITVRADPGGAACQVFSGVLAETLSLHLGGPYDATHPRCRAHGAGDCEWTARPGSASADA